jgi:hypothetical protein
VKWCARILIGDKRRHLGYFGAGRSGEVDVALAFEATVWALGPDGWSTNNASERTKFEVPGQRVRGLSREQAADVEAWLERHLRRVLLACKADGAAKGVGEAFERQLPGQVMLASAAHGALPQNTVPARAPRGLLRPGVGAAGLVGAGRAAGAGRRRRAGRRGNEPQHVSELALPAVVEFAYMGKVGLHGAIIPVNT